MIHPCTKFHNVILYNSTMGLWASGPICLARIPHMPQFQFGLNLVQTLLLLFVVLPIFAEKDVWHGKAGLSKNDTVVAHVGISHKSRESLHFCWREGESGESLCIVCSLPVPAF